MSDKSNRGLVLNSSSIGMSTRIELFTFVVLLAVGLTLREFPSLSSYISNVLDGLARNLGLPAEPQVRGLVIGMLVAALSIRAVIVVAMQLLIARASEPLLLDMPTIRKVVLWKLFQVAMTIMIFYLIVQSRAFQGNVADIFDSHFSVLAVALVIHVFAGSLADAAKQIVFVLNN